MGNNENPQELEGSKAQSKQLSPEEKNKRDRKMMLAFYYVFCGYCLGETVIGLLQRTDWGSHLDLGLFSGSRYLADLVAVILFCLVLRLFGDNAQKIATISVIAMLVLQFIMAK
jgi:hypothetical protein